MFTYMFTKLLSHTTAYMRHIISINRKLSLTESQENPIDKISLDENI